MAVKKAKKSARKSNAGAPEKYREEYAERVYDLALLGLKDTEIAAVFQVSEPTLNKWKKQHPEFFKSLNEGKAIADGKVARRLYERALGFETIEEKLGPGGMVVELKTVCPPDTAAAIFWLKNRQRANWRDKVETGMTDKDGNDVPPAFDLSKLTNEELRTLAELQRKGRTGQAQLD